METSRDIIIYILVCRMYRNTYVPTYVHPLIHEFSTCINTLRTYIPTIYVDTTRYLHLVYILGTVHVFIMYYVCHWTCDSQNY